MATKPGILTEWPWTWLGSYKYVVLAPWATHSVYSYMVQDEKERDFTNLLVIPLLVWRMVHNQMWMSLSRYRTAKGSNRIVDKAIEFQQVDRERNWDDQIILSGFMLYSVKMWFEGAQRLRWWSTDGLIWSFVVHAGPVEFLYYWLHRALHHHFLYSRYHSHHHSSIATEPVTSVVHPFAEHIAYYMVFSMPFLATIYMRNMSILSAVIYFTYIDFMNNMGHCNFEFLPTRLFSIFPPLKYLIYTPSYHSLHHTQFRTNYSLFMPFYDYLYGTMDISSDSLYQNSLVRKEESPHVVHLTHLTTPESIYHLRLGFAFLASQPQKFKWYLWLMWPLTLCSMTLTWLYGRTFTLERNVYKHLNLQTWVIPKYSIQYYMQWQRGIINSMIEDSILEAEAKGVRVLSLGLLNQDEGLNRNGELFVRRNPQLKLKLVDGSSLAVAVVLNSLPIGTAEVVLRGNLSKVAYSVALALCQGGIQVYTVSEGGYKRLKAKLSKEAGNNLFLSKNSAPKTWLVGDGVSEEEQLKAPQGTTFFPLSHFPPKEVRKDCFYNCTPAMQAPKNLENVDSCENWLPRRVMSAWRVAGIVHGVEGWDVHECGNMMFDVEKMWRASLKHGFRPFFNPIPN